MIGAGFLLAVAVAADLTILFGGIPLLHDTYAVLNRHTSDQALLLQLLAANLAMLLLVVAAMVAWGMLGTRAVCYLVRLAPRVFARPIPVRQTRYRR